MGLSKIIVENSEKLAKIKQSLYRYIRDWNYRLKYENSINDIFQSARAAVLEKIKVIAPDLQEILASTYDNLSSNKPVDWSNAVHNCRRVLQELANGLYPATNEEIDI